MRRGGRSRNCPRPAFWDERHNIPLRRARRLGGKVHRIPCRFSIGGPAWFLAFTLAQQLRVRCALDAPLIGGRVSRLNQGSIHREVLLPATSPRLLEQSAYGPTAPRLTKWREISCWVLAQVSWQRFKSGLGLGPPVSWQRVSSGAAASQGANYGNRRLDKRLPERSADEGCREDGPRKAVSTHERTAAGYLGTRLEHPEGVWVLEGRQEGRRE